MQRDQNLIKLVDEWPLPGLTPSVRTKIKSQLLKAHAAFLRTSWRDVGRHIPSMQQSFSGIASVLFDAKLLTVELLENQLRLLILESATAGGWFPLPEGEPRTEIFPGYLGQASVWARYDVGSPQLFEAEIAEWKSKLLDAEAGGSVPAKSPEATGESVGAQLNRLREECRLTVEELADELDVEPRSIYRHLSDASIPYKRHVGAYERVFSEILKRKVVIRKMSGRRQ